MRTRLLILLLALPMLASCGLAGPSCDPPHGVVFAEYRGTFAIDGTPRDVRWHAAAARDWLLPMGYQELLAVLFGGSGQEGRFGAVFAGFGAVFPTPLVAGDTLPVTWALGSVTGFVPGQRPDSIRISLHDDRVSSLIPVSGIAVVERDAKGMRIHLLARSDAGLRVSFALDGWLRFWKGELPGTCYSY